MEAYILGNFAKTQSRYRCCVHCMLLNVTQNSIQKQAAKVLGFLLLVSYLKTPKRPVHIGLRTLELAAFQTRRRNWYIYQKPYNPKISKIFP